jgi:hypothetical protein
VTEPAVCSATCQGTQRASPWIAFPVFGSLMASCCSTPSNSYLAPAIRFGQGSRV